MDFADFTYSGPRVANTDFSPQQESLTYNDNFDKPYLVDSYTTAPDHSLDSFFDYDSFLDRPITSVEGPARPGSFVSTSNGALNTTLPATATGPSNPSNLNPNSAFRQSFNPTPFGQLEQFPSGFSFGPVRSTSFESSCVSPQTHNTSRTPSLCGDGMQYHQSSSPEPALRSLKRESSSEPSLIEEEPTPKRPQRKRGRPRLDRSATDNQSSSSPTTNSQRNSRLPHNQVERKYREGLNSELERLRKAVPTLPQSEDGGVMGKPKPSKAMVLAGAIDYIKRIERERDMLRDENDKLRHRQ